MNRNATEPEATPPAALLQMMTGYWISQGIYVAAKLGIADLLTDGPRAADDLAAATKSHAPSLYRLLRGLASAGVFNEVAPGSFALAEIGNLLRTDMPGSMHPLAIMYAEEQYRAWGEALYSVRTGKPAFDLLYGMPVFDYYAQNPEAAGIFNAAMTGYTNQLAGAVVSSYDFTPYDTIVDVGGGHGALLCHILRAHSQKRGLLFDRPQVIAGAAPFLEAAGVASRCECVGGNFFVTVPSGGDVYVLEQVLHDWDDVRCVSILESVRRAMRSEAKLLVIELLIPPGNEPYFGKWLDLHMLVMAPGGKERTRTEYEALFDASGFKLRRSVLTPAGASVVEAIPV